MARRSASGRSPPTTRRSRSRPGVFFPAWTYNGRVPGPTLRANEGDRLRIVLHERRLAPALHAFPRHPLRRAWTASPASAGLRSDPGEEFIYEFDANPFGCHLYHCHALPLKRHIHKGCTAPSSSTPIRPHPEQGDAAQARHLGYARESAAWQEFVMVMNAFDTNFDAENEVYAVNTVAFAYMKHPIAIDRTRPVRIYLVNVTEFDPINSFHLHANFFDYYDHGTTLDADAAHRRHDHAVPGAARHPRVHLRGSRAGHLHVPRPPVSSSPSSAGWGCSMSVSTAPEPLIAPAAERMRERQTGFSPRSLIWAVVPLLLLAAVLALIVRTDAGLGDRTVPPIETLSVQRVLLPAPNQIELDVVNGGPDPITIAQVLVDDAYWQFSMEPAGTLERLQSAKISIPYPVGRG